MHNSAQTSIYPSSYEINFRNYCAFFSSGTSGNPIFFFSSSNRGSIWMSRGLERPVEARGTHERLIILPVDDLERGFGISIPEFPRYPSFPRPLEFVSEKTAFVFFDEVDLVLFPGPPEEKIHRARLVSLLLNSFHYQEVFPELADVVPQSRGIEVGDQGVPDTRVKKVIFRLLGHFVAEVPAETAEGEDHKTLFEKIEIAPHGLVIQPDLLGQLAKGDLGADLESQEP